VPLILVVDDEPAIRESLAFALKRDGFAIAEAASLREAEARTPGADLLILEETDRVVGLEMGADDYVLKPFSPREVVARVRAVLRRVRSDRPPADSVESPIDGPGRLRVDPRTRRASVGATELALSRTEFNLLAAFLRAPGRVFERGQLLDAVWGSDVVVGDRTVDVHVKALRRKLEDAGGDPKLLETVRGVGYRLKDSP
jgi:DNA-binding response OmpR family regulator